MIFTWLLLGLAHLVQSDVGLDGGVDAEGGAAVLVVDDAQSVTEIAMTAINLVAWPLIVGNKMGVTARVVRQGLYKSKIFIM